MSGKGNYPEYVLRAVRQRLNLDEQDDSQDKIIQALPPSYIFNQVVEWEGFLGYTQTIRGWVEDIYGINLHD